MRLVDLVDNSNFTLSIEKNPQIVSETDWKKIKLTERKHRHNIGRVGISSMHKVVAAYYNYHSRYYQSYIFIENCKYKPNLY